jgi:hypothetical protein
VKGKTVRARSACSSRESEAGEIALGDATCVAFLSSSAARGKNNRVERQDGGGVKCVGVNVMSSVCG